MTNPSDRIRQGLRLGEDSRREFKQVEFSGNRPASPTRGDWADEITAFANANGGMLYCGVKDNREIQGLNSQQMEALDELLTAIGSDIIEPPIRIETSYREMDGKAFLLVRVPKGVSLHTYKGRSFIRAGASKRQMNADERLRLSERRAMSRYLWFDEQAVPRTGLETLDVALWRPLVSTQGAADPEISLAKLGLLEDSGPDEVQRATVAGVLLCSQEPERWMRNAVVMATRYRGVDRASGQIDAQEIKGPLRRQIADTVAFAVRNMQVAARKVPERIDVPQYSERAIFEAVVNAVVHRDYSIHSSRIRLSIFSNRLEIQSPGAPPNNLTLETIARRQASRNETIASLMAWTEAAGIRGSGDRRYIMERRGDGVPIIQQQTRSIAGRLPKYRLIDGTDVVLTIPAAPLDVTSTREIIAVRAEGRPVPGAEVLALYPNGTWKHAVADDDGEAVVDLYTTELPMTVLCAAPGFAGAVVRDWLPSRSPLALELRALPSGGSVLFSDATGQVPGLRGRLNPVRDDLDRTYLYTSNIAVERGRAQPVHFGLGDELHLADADGAYCFVRILEVIGRSALVEHRLPEM